MHIVVRRRRDVGIHIEYSLVSRTRNVSYERAKVRQGEGSWIEVEGSKKTISEREAKSAKVRQPEGSWVENAGSKRTIKVKQRPKSAISKQRLHQVKVQA